jgi:hypothetical protein
VFFQSSWGCTHELIFNKEIKMNPILEGIFFTIGFFVVFGGISWLFGKIEDFIFDITSEVKIGRKTGRKIEINGRVLEEVENRDNPDETVYIE